MSIITDALGGLALIVPVLIVWTWTVRRQMATRTREMAEANRALAESEERFRSIFDNVNDAIFIHDFDSGAILSVNRRALEMYGYDSEAEMRAATVEDLSEGSPPYDQQTVMVGIAKAAAGEPQLIDWLARTRTGRLFWVQVSMRCDHIGNAGKRLLVLVRDISERKEAELRLRTFKAAVDSSLSPIIITDSTAQIEYVNDAFVSSTGYEVFEVMGCKPSLLKSGKTPPEVYQELWQTVLAGRGWRGDFLNRRKNGSEYWESASIAPVMDDRGVIAHFVGVKEDISERKRVEEELWVLANTDPLTGLSNRRSFLNAATNEFQRARRFGHPLTVLMFDIDYFKRINDSFGHPTGDIVIRTVSDLLRSTLRDVDLVGRLGGEEFAAVLLETTMDKAMDVAERARAAVAAMTCIGEGGEAVVFTVSVGVASHDGDDQSFDSILGRADKALYQAKQGGRNQVCVAAAVTG